VRIAESLAVVAVEKGACFPPDDKGVSATLGQNVLFELGILLLRKRRDCSLKLGVDCELVHVPLGGGWLYTH